MTQDQQEQREQWDAVVIGSGLGGLACAAYLGAAGKRTLVLEAHYVAGGNSQTFRRGIHGRRYEFDIGVHYIGECGPEGLITRMLRGVGLDGRLRFRPLERDGYTTLIFPDFRFRVPAGWDRYRARLLETLPEEREPLGHVVDILRDVAESSRRFQNREAEPHGATAEPAMIRWGLRPITDLLAEYHLSQRATAVLLGEGGVAAVPPSRTPTVLAAGIIDHYMRGAFYPEGGGQVIAGRLVEAIRAYGGEVWTRTPVRRVRIERGRVAGVELVNGGAINAPVVVSNADLKRTVCELVGEQHFPVETVERVRSYRMALPMFVVFLGLDVDLGAQDFPNTNLLMWGSYDLEAIYAELEAGRIPEAISFFITVPTIKDPANRRLAPPGHSNVLLMTLVPRDYAFWHVDPETARTGAYHRDAGYRCRKDALMERLIDEAERFIPDLRRHLDWQEAATPPTQERFTWSTGGTSYGIEYACDQMGPMRMGPHTEVPGLYLAGANTPSGHGISSVLRSGVLAAAAVLERDLLRAALRGDVLGDRDRLPPLREDWDPWRECH